jgi:GT2 family glycosyltransferase
MAYSIIILSRTLANLLPCIAAVRAQGETAHIIVIDDGIGADWTVGADPWVWLEGKQPFIYARNVNQGILAAGTDDVVLLNDDALLKSLEGFKTLSVLLRTHPTLGLLGAVTNVTGYPAQLPQTPVHTTRVTDTIAFVCVYIPRSTIETVGLLDEQFVAYGGEDVDYCIRVREAGLQVAVSDFCYVDHGSLRSTFRGEAHAPGDIAEGIRLLRAKWGAKAPRFPC